jgi:hypothetical protein
VRLREIGGCKRSNLNAVAELARGTTALSHAWFDAARGRNTLG